MKAPSKWAQLKSVLALPFVVTAVVPYLLLQFVPEVQFALFPIAPVTGKVLGVLVFVIGLSVFVRSIILFIKIGRGTLAPWNPTKKLVVKSLYRYVRNPMILGVLNLLLAEAFFFGSLVILIWAVLFFTINHFYFILKEEPNLLKRFGTDYQEYKDNVPRWLPRLSGWKPEAK